MKYTLDGSMEEIILRSRKLKVLKVQRQVLRRTVLAFVVLVMLAWEMYWLIGLGESHAGSMVYGAFMLPNDAGGYVLVGVASFILAVIVTLVCVRIAERKKSSHNDSNED